MRKIVVCPDSFKGSLSARQAAEIISSVLSERFPETEIVPIPLADGGEGTAEILSTNYPEEKTIDVSDPFFRKIKAKLHISCDGKSCFIESADAVGLTLLDLAERDPLKTSSYGLGEMILLAAKAGCKEIFVSIGGSAVCDGGLGMMRALGYRFLDKDRSELIGRGKDMIQIVDIDSSGVYPNLKDINLHVICDVINPLFGENGAAYIYAPQKGAKPEDLPILDDGLKNLAFVCARNGLSAASDSLLPGAGAAGGLGFAFRSLLKADYINGIQFVLQQLDFERKIDDADLIITGEGKIDRQSLMGKVLDGVLAIANSKDIPVIAIGGMVEDHEILRNSGLKTVIEIKDPSLSVEENISSPIAKRNLRQAIATLPLIAIFPQ